MLKGREYVRAKLAEHCLTQTWLTHELIRQGFDTSQAAVSLALTGMRKGEPSQKLILAATDILKHYETVMC